MDQALLDQVKELTLPLLKELNTELVELTLARNRGKAVLRFLVDKPGRITVGECAELNQQIGRILDEENLIGANYILEVSSPGLDRPLEAARDFQRHLGELIKVILHSAIDKQNVWIGVIEQIDEENLTIRTEQGRYLTIARQQIAKAKLEVRV